MLVPKGKESELVNYSPVYNTETNWEISCFILLVDSGKFASFTKSWLFGRVYQPEKKDKRKNGLTFTFIYEKTNNTEGHSKNSANK